MAVFKSLLIVMQMLDGDMYDRVRDFYSLLAVKELECCGITQECFTRIVSDANLVNYDLRFF